jgi:Flp pilus assembly protein TadG
MSAREPRGNSAGMCLQKEIRRDEPTVLRRRLTPDRRGVALVEFAMVFPVLTTLLLGTFWIGRAVSVYQALERAAREGARVAVVHPCASCNPGAANDSAIDDAVDDALQAASLDMSNPDLRIEIARNQPLDSSVPPNYQASAVTVTVFYSVHLNIPFTSLKAAKIPLSSRVSMRQEF